MDARLAPESAELIPWTKEEYSLLTFRQIDQKRSRRWFGSGKGTYISKFHEPLFSYAYQMIYGYTNLLIQVRTARWSFSFWKKSKFTEVACNHRFFGKILNNNTLVSGKKVLAKIEHPRAEYHPIHVGKRIVAEFSDPKNSGQYNPTVFEFVKDMTEDEALLFTAISLNHLLRLELKKKK